MRKTALILFSVLSLAACGKQDGPELPKDPITATGTLLPADLSLSRRGTHILRINGVDTYYVESTTVNLRNAEGKIVGLHGKLSKNLDPSALPLLMVDVMSEHQTKGQQVSLSQFQMRLTLPEGWTQEDIANGTAFSSSGSTPLLAVTKTQYLTLPDGISLLLGGRKAVRTLNADNSETFFVDSPSGIVSVATLVPLTATGTVRADLSTIVRSIQFQAVAASKSAASASGSDGSSQAARQPCGGPAGILCPQGSFCAITDSSTNVGFCQQMNR